MSRRLNPFWALLLGLLLVQIGVAAQAHDPSHVDDGAQHHCALCFFSASPADCSPHFDLPAIEGVCFAESANPPEAICLPVPDCADPRAPPAA